MDPAGMWRTVDLLDGWFALLLISCPTHTIESDEGKGSLADGFLVRSSS